VVSLICTPFKINISASVSGNGSGRNNGGYTWFISSNDFGEWSRWASCSLYDHIYNGENNKKDTHTDQVGLYRGIQFSCTHTPLYHSERTDKRINENAAFTFPSDLADFSSSNSVRAQQFYGDDIHDRGYNKEEEFTAKKLSHPVLIRMSSVICPLLLLIRSLTIIAPFNLVLQTSYRRISVCTETINRNGRWLTAVEEE